jgi:hypothetical protein
MKRLSREDFRRMLDLLIDEVKKPFVKYDVKKDYRE